MLNNLDDIAVFIILAVATITHIYIDTVCSI